MSEFWLSLKNIGATHPSIQPYSDSETRPDNNSHQDISEQATLLTLATVLMHHYNYHNRTFEDRSNQLALFIVPWQSKLQDDNNYFLNFCLHKNNDNSAQYSTHWFVLINFEASIGCWIFLRQILITSVAVFCFRSLKYLCNSKELYNI